MQEEREKRKRKGIYQAITTPCAWHVPFVKLEQKSSAIYVCPSGLAKVDRAYALGQILLNFVGLSPQPDWSHSKLSKICSNGTLWS